MNKVTLVKSFAGYPVWEYELEWNYYSMEKDLQSSWPTKYHQIHKDIVERFKDYFEEIKERPTSWEELWEIDWCWVDSYANVMELDMVIPDDSGASVFKTEQQAEASIALAMITQLLDKYDIPEESKTRFWQTDGMVICDDYKHEQSRNKLIVFDTPEKQAHFYKHHKALIDKLAPFYIF